MHTCSQTSMETQGELKGSELPGESGTTWSNNPMVNAFPSCSLTVPHHPRDNDFILHVPSERC